MMDESGLSTTIVGMAPVILTVEQTESRAREWMVISLHWTKEGTGEVGVDILRSGCSLAAVGSIGEY